MLWGDATRRGERAHGLLQSGLTVWEMMMRERKAASHVMSQDIIIHD